MIQLHPRIDKQHLFLKLRTAGSVLCLLLNCQCLGFGPTKDIPHKESPTGNGTYQPQAPQPSAPSYEAVQNEAAAQNRPVTPPYPGPTPPPSYKEAIALDAPEEAAQPPSYKEAIALGTPEAAQPPSYKEAIALDTPEAVKNK